MTTRKRKRRGFFTPHSALRNPKSRKRGIVLLVVVSLLAIFILMGVAFAIVAMHYQKTADRMPSIERYGDPAEREAELVLDQILFDRNGRSSLRGHSVLGDEYGADGVFDDDSDSNTDDNTKLFGAGATQLNGQVLQFQVRPATLQNVGGPLSPVPNYYCGRVLTFTQGPSGGYSGRIMRYDPAATGGPTFAIEVDYSSGGTYALPADGDHFLINGAPFNGTGMGYDNQTYNMNAVYGHSATYSTLLPPANQVDLAALLPHFNGYDLNFGSLYFNAAGTPSQQSLAQIGLGGADEPYDAVDLQNMFLAMVLPGTAVDPTLPVVPSYHRPELVNYWVTRIIDEILVPAGYDPSTQFPQMVQIITQPYGPDRVRGTPDDPSSWSPPVPIEQLDRIYGLMHGSIFRPMPWDHPNFSGSNVNLSGNFAYVLDSLSANMLATPFPGAPLNPWDIDNDGDLVPDSNWVDVGLPVSTRPDGRRYKRLAAILIKDLGGRADPNAHGNLAQLVGVNQATTPVTFGLASAATVPRGMGYGPAEVSFLNLLGNDTTAYGSLLLGRYGSSFPGDNGMGARPGIPSSPEALNIVKHHGVPNDYANLGGAPLQTFYANMPTWYASPPDVWGRGAIVLDYGGHPVWSYTATVGEATDTPYELSLSGASNNSDSPYTVTELEQLYRYQDADIAQLRGTALPPYQTSRFFSYTDSTGTSALAGDVPGSPAAPYAQRRESLGFNSHIPTPSAIVPPELRTNPYFTGEPYTDANSNGRWDLGETYTDSFANGMYDAPKWGAVSILDLYRWRLTAYGAANVNEEMQRIVPWEFFKGQKFDVNRWLGDGTDGFDGDADGLKEIPGSLNGVRDDMLEATQNEWGWEIGPTNFTNPRVVAQHTNSVEVNESGPVADSGDNYYARQLYARHLFCLAMLQLPDNFQPDFPQESGLDGAAGIPVLARRELIIRRIAQWAINCVDFRDHDAVMTAFEYDVNPWNGWGVDAELGTDGAPGNEEWRWDVASGMRVKRPPTSERRVVWGMEYPDLMLTESLAIHCRHVKDTALAGPTGNGDKKRDDAPTADDDLDQFRLPEGSLFVELWCPRANLWTSVGQTPNQKPQLPLELYDANGRLALGRLAPGGRPVWRLALAPVLNNNATYGPRHPQSMYGPYHESATFDPEQVSLLPAGTQPGGYQSGPVAPLNEFRFAYFGPAPGVPPAELQRSYYNTATNPLLEPGQYAVIGPRPVTYLGSMNPSGVAPILWNPMAGVMGYSPQRIEMDPTASPPVFRVYRTDGTIQTPVSGAQNVRPVLPIVASYTTTPVTNDPVTMVPTLWSKPWTQGLNITEPLLADANHPNFDGTNGGNYYPEPTVTPTTANSPPGIYDDPDPAVALNDGTGFRDIPVEADTPMSDGSGPGRPIRDQDMQATETYEDVSSVYLQRLANPAMPYNPPPGDPLYNAALPINPYLTIDWLTIDAHVFAGDEDTNTTVATGPYMGENLDPNDPAAGAGNDWPVFFRSRQRGYTQADDDADVIKSNPWSPLTQNRSLTSNNPDSWPGPGIAGAYIRYELRNDYLTQVPPTYQAGNDRQTLGYLNDPVDVPHTNTSYPGEPANPFPWLAWHNRPFTSPFELLQVPSSAPSRACSELTPGTLLGNGYINNGLYYDGTNNQTFRSPFGHLLNFFHAANAGTNANDEPNFYRMLEYLEVPSPYAGAEKWFNPQQFGGADYFRPPFNKLSRYRDPGRININTIFTEEVWYSAVAQFPGMNTGGFWNAVAHSRKNIAAAPWYNASPGQPTRFGNPFRPAEAADLMPDVAGMRQANPIQATLLRPTDPTIATPQPLFAMSSAAQHNNTEQNPYFRYEGFQKLGNTFSTTSNCFAVWITIGYFEVDVNTDPVTGNKVIDAAHPDGYQLGQEVGVDSGEVVRHRSFYIIDRSVPVGFQPGQKLNTDDCILLRRFIE